MRGLNPTGQVRALMADAAELRNRAAQSSRPGDMLADADRYEKRAKQICDQFNLGDARFV